MKRCRDCANMPCTKEECDINNQIGCKDYESQVAEVMKTVSVDGLNYKFERIDE